MSWNAHQKYILELVACDIYHADKYWIIVGQKVTFLTVYTMFLEKYPFVYLRDQAIYIGARGRYKCKFSYEKKKKKKKKRMPHGKKRWKKWKQEKSPSPMTLYLLYLSTSIGATAFQSLSISVKNIAATAFFSVNIFSLASRYWKNVSNPWLETAKKYPPHALKQ